MNRKKEKAGNNGRMENLVLTKEEMDIIVALRDPEKRAALMQIKEQSEEQALTVA